MITGILIDNGATVTVRFNRVVRETAPAVWAALTEPVILQEWLAAAEFEPRVEGAVHFVWPGQGEMRGHVRVFSEPAVLEYGWDEASGSSLLRFEIEPTSDSTCALRLIHSGTSRADASGLGAGWQSHLEALDTVLDGGVSSARERDVRYHELDPLYVRALAEI